MNVERTIAATARDADYMTGFGSHFATEAVPGALPVGQNSPQQVPFGLYAEQLSGTAFTAPRHENRRSWLYRMRPSAEHPPFTRYDGAARFAPGTIDEPLAPNRLRWDPIAETGSDTDLIDGMTTMLANRDPADLEGVAVHVYAAGKDMTDRVFVDADGELLFIPQEGRLELLTELGRMVIAPGEIALIPRGLRFRALLPDGSAAAAMSRRIMARCSAFPISARSAPTALPTRAISRRRKPGTKTATSRWSSCRNISGRYGPRRWVTARSMSSPGTAIWRRSATICRAST